MQHIPAASETVTRRKLLITFKSILTHSNSNMLIILLITPIRTTPTTTTIITITISNNLTAQPISATVTMSAHRTPTPPVTATVLHQPVSMLAADSHWATSAFWAITHTVPSQRMVDTTRCLCDPALRLYRKTEAR